MLRESQADMLTAQYMEDCAAVAELVNDSRQTW